MLCIKLRIESCKIKYTYEKTIFVDLFDWSDAYGICAKAVQGRILQP